MTSIYDILRYEDLTSNRGHFFDDSDYTYQKTRMMVFLKCEAEEVWDVVETCPYIPKNTVDGVETFKPKGRMD